MEFESGQAGLTFRYTYAHNRPNSVVITGIPNGVGAIDQGGFVKLFYHTDRLGSVDFLTSNIINQNQRPGQGQNSRVQTFNNYDSWGLPLGGSNSDPRGNNQNNNSNNMTTIRLGARQLNLATSFQGFMYDQVLNLYFAQARMYDPSTRRFMAVDPIRGNIFNPQLMVPYTFVLNNPLRWVDPLGLSPIPSTHVGLRDFAEAAGADVGWNQDTMQASVTMGGVTKHFYHGDAIGSINVDGRMQVHADELAWLFDLMDWDNICCCDLGFLDDNAGEGAARMAFIVAMANSMNSIHANRAEVGAVLQRNVQILVSNIINAGTGAGLVPFGSNVPAPNVPNAPSRTDILLGVLGSLLPPATPANGVRAGMFVQLGMDGHFQTVNGGGGGSNQQTVADPFRIITREEWRTDGTTFAFGPLFPNVDGITTIVVHHTDTPATAGVWRGWEDRRTEYEQRLINIEDDHGRRRPSHGGMAYHFLIMPDGSIYEGRPLSYQGWATGGNPSPSQIDVALVGQFSAASPGSAQIEAMYGLMDHLRDEFPINNVRRHASWCPGAWFDPLIPIINDNISAGRPSGTPQTQTTPIQTPTFLCGCGLPMGICNRCMTFDIN